MKDPQNENLDIASSCELAENRIHELLDLRQPLLSDEAIRNHIAKCDQCAELVVDLGALNESLSQIPVETLHRLSGLQLEPGNNDGFGRQRQLHPVSFIASIACLLLVLLTSGIWFSPSSEDSVALVNIVNTETATYDSIPAIETSPSEVFLPGQFTFVTMGHQSSPSELLNAVSFEQISGGVGPFREYFEMTADLPGIRPVSHSVNATYHLIRSMSQKPAIGDDDLENGPDVGFHDPFVIELCCV